MKKIINDDLLKMRIFEEKNYFLKNEIFKRKLKKWFKRKNSINESKIKESKRNNQNV